MRILGIDPGIATIGFGVVDSDKNGHKLINCGVISTPAHTSLSSRLEQIYDDMCQLIDLFKPEAVSIEELFFNTNITTGIAVAHGRGVILLACRKAGLKVYEYTPLQVKSSVVGYGQAVKKQVQEMTRILLHLPAIPKPDDTADALAMAITFCHTNGNQLNRFRRQGVGPI